MDNLTIVKTLNRGFVEVICNICHNDKGLFPRPLKVSLTEITRGDNKRQIPCHCKSNKSYTEEQIITIINRFCEANDYTFLYMVGPFKGTTETKIVLWDNITQTQTPPQRIRKLLRNNKVISKNVTFRSKLAKSEDAVIKNLQEENLIPTSVKIYKDHKNVVRGNYNKNWLYECNKCRQDIFSLNLISDHVFKTTLTSLKEGHQPCRCSSNYHYSKEEYIYLINNRLGEIKGSLRKIPPKITARSYFEWTCSENHNNTQQIDGFLNKGYMCDECRKLNCEYGLYKDRVTDPDTLYLICMHNRSECFLKIGRSFNLSARYSKSHPYFNSIVFLYEDTHLNIYNIEQSLIKKYKDSKYNPDIKFSGSSRECFHLGVQCDILKDLQEL